MRARDVQRVPRLVVHAVAVFAQHVRFFELHHLEHVRVELGRVERELVVHELVPRRQLTVHPPDVPVPERDAAVARVSRKRRDEVEREERLALLLQAAALVGDRALAAALAHGRRALRLRAPEELVDEKAILGRVGAREGVLVDRDVVEVDPHAHRRAKVARRRVLHSRVIVVPPLRRERAVVALDWPVRRTPARTRERGRRDCRAAERRENYHPRSATAHALRRVVRELLDGRRTIIGRARAAIGHPLDLHRAV